MFVSGAGLPNPDKTCYPAAVVCRPRHDLAECRAGADNEGGGIPIRVAEEVAGSRVKRVKFAAGPNFGQLGGGMHVVSCSAIPSRIGTAVTLAHGGVRYLSRAWIRVCRHIPLGGQLIVDARPGYGDLGGSHRLQRAARNRQRGVCSRLAQDARVCVEWGQPELDFAAAVLNLTKLHHRMPATA